MANLGLENLGQSLQVDDLQIGGGGASTISEKRVSQEMARQGMDQPSAASQSVRTFSDVLRHSVDDVNQAQANADRAIQELVSGRTKNIHETLLAVEKADSSLKLMMQVRNKILDAYKEIMRMQV